MTAMQCSKGKVGEREIAATIRDLTGWDVRRRVRQHGGDSDLGGVTGWSPEVKRRRSAGRSKISGWWDQAVEQAIDGVPMLIYRVDRAEWRAVWPLVFQLTDQRAECRHANGWTAEGTVEARAAVAGTTKSMKPSAIGTGAKIGASRPFSRLTRRPVWLVLLAKKCQAISVSEELRE